MSERLHALLIGIDCYLPNRLPGGERYDSLSGSVRDIERVERFLREECGHRPERIIKLTASCRADETPVESQEKWPTYENIVKAFWELTRGAQRGNQVYIHYSGHGGRPATLFPEIRGAGGYDEALVPCNIGDSRARYLRGPELNWLVRDMVEKELIVTIVLDCCHAGGVRRGDGGPVRRGLGTIDTTLRPPESLVAERKALLGILRRLQPEGSPMRNLIIETPWLGDPKGYVLLAACRPQDSAYEFPFENDESQGALTYYLLDTLRSGGTSLTYKQIHERVYAKVHNQFQSQTPMLAGESSRRFLGIGHVPSSSAATVMAVEGNRVLLNTGQVQGIRPGMRFAVYAPAADVATSERLALAEIRELGATDSWAEIVECTRTLIEQGAQAVLVGSRTSPENTRQQSVVCLVPARDGRGEVALERVRNVLAAEAYGFVRLGAEGETADLQVAISELGVLEIRKPGAARLPNLPPIVADTPGATDEAVRRLVHLTKYFNVDSITNEDASSPLAGKLGLRVLGSQADFVPGAEPRPRPLAGAAPYQVSTGEWVFIEVSNHSSRVLNLAVLDLQPDWGITQIFPKAKDVDFWPLDPRQTVTVQICGSLPEGLSEGTDTIKFLATLGSTSFRWLEMPALARQAQETSLAVTPHAKRHMAVSIFASREWTVEKLEILVRRRPGTAPSWKEVVLETPKRG